MINIRNSLFIFFFPLFVFANQNVFNWESMTSLINVKSITQNFDDSILGVADGGILKLTNDIEVIDDSSFDLIKTDSKGMIWAVSNSLSSKIQVFDSNFNIIYNSIYSLPNIDSIIDLEFSESKVFTIYESQNEIGILEFNNEDSLPYYVDYYNSDDFPENFNNITDIDLYQSNIYVTTDSGIFVADHFQNNLNLSSSWTLIPFESFIGNIDILFMHRINSGFYLITNDEIYFCSTDFIVSPILNFTSDPMDVKENNQNVIFCSKDSCYFLNNSSYELIYQCDEYFLMNDFYCKGDFLFIAIENGGLAKFNLNNENIDHFIPNTLLENSYKAIAILDDGSLAGINKTHGFIYKQNRYDYFLAKEFADSFPIPLLSLNENFTFTILDYEVSDKMIWSIVQNSKGNIMFNNSGIKPDITSLKGGIIEINPINFDFIIYDTSKTDFIQSTSYPYGTLDGLYGISNENVTDSYMVTHQIKKDNQGNIWVVNPFSEKYNHPLSVQLNGNNQHWMHIFSDDEVSYVPTELAFDRYNRVWLGFKNEKTNNNCCVDDFSDGGIKVFQYTDTYLNGTNFDIYDENVFWLNPTNLDDLPYGKNSTILSLDIGLYDNQEILWVLTPQGAQGYILNNTQLLEIYPLPFYSNLSFQEGDKIRTDSQNNAWIVTRHDGIRVIKGNASLWPNGEGFTAENSELLSDYVYDIAFDNFNGLAYLATENGISILEIPFSDSNENYEQLYITPQPFIIPSDERMKIKKIINGSDVKIITINGRVLKKFNNIEYNQNIIYWDGKDDDGNYLSSGIYYILSYKNGKSISKKIAIIRK